MHQNNNNKIILALSLSIAVLVIIAGYFGIFIPETYSRETPNWHAQAVGQDMVNSFVVAPFLLITALFAYKKNRIAELLWSGALLYLIYTFVIYCFAVHFNTLFVVYCLILGLSFYSFMHFLISHLHKPIRDWFKEKIPVKPVAIYLIVFSCLFYILWLMEIIPAIMSNSTPKGVIDIGMPTNPVHALDLSLCLPGFFITAVLLLKRKGLGFLLAPAILVFCILMDITIGTLVIVMKMNGIEASLVLTGIMGFLALVSAMLLIMFLKNLKPESHS